FTAPGTGKVGESITYTFVVTNTGNVTMSNVVVSDPMPDISAIDYVAWPGANNVLAPGESVTATATYVLKLADVNNGHVTNTATVTGTPPGSATPITPVKSTDPTPEDPDPTKTVVKIIASDLSVTKTANS